VTWPRALLVWALLFVAVFANGAVRVFTYQRYIGERAANQLSAATGIALFAVVIWAVTRAWPFPSPARAWRTGLLWVALTVAWEFLFGHFFMGRPWNTLFADYEIWNGRLWPLVLAWLAVAPRLSMANLGRSPAGRPRGDSIPRA
jgi:hypothetical protein